MDGVIPLMTTFQYHFSPYVKLKNPLELVPVREKKEFDGVGLTPEQRRERDAKALQEKAAKKAAGGSASAGGGGGGNSSNKK
ncbi:hypothetical protein CFP56_042090 [Quercus suber]|uniref:Small EDRK-rich factor-like N-terminal domain-containing protein n=1 Tax=Quercus suber TaxID=58331 RepID=A0AAW0M9W3_QUESU